MFLKPVIFRKEWLVIMLLTVTHVGVAQRNSEADTLLHQIAGAQVKKDSFYFRGSFPSFRHYGAGGKLKPDNNIFFTGLVAFTLQELKPYLDSSQQALCDSVIQRAQQAYPHFKNKGGRPTYNFWRVEPPLVFPNSWFLNHFNASHALPDDLDDTSILWLTFLHDSTRGNYPSDSILLLVKKLMGEHANGGENWIRNTYNRYSSLRAYSTWFGIKMPIDFDFCVLCNVLYFVNAYQLPLNVHDSATVELLRQMITDGSYLRRAAYISPHYGRTPLLLYHISRLLGRFSVPALDTLKPRLLKASYLQYHKAGTWLDSVLLSTSVIRLGGKPLAVSRPRLPDLYQTDKTFFVASFSDIFSNFWKKMMLNNQLIKYYFVCPAFRKALYLENMVLSENYTH